MATKSNMFSAEMLRDRPQRGNAEFGGRAADPEKVAFLDKVIADYRKFASVKANQEAIVVDGKDMPVPVNGDWTAAALAITANAMLVKEATEADTVPQFHFVATDRALKVDDDGAAILDDKGNKQYEQPTTLIIRWGAKPTRKRGSNGDAADADVTDGDNGEASEE